MTAAYPLDRFFADDGGFAAAQAGWQQSLEEGVAVCMRTAGFTYVPPAPITDSIYSSQSRLTEAEWTSRHGYGIVDGYLETIQRGLDDPNSTYRASLTPGELSEYEIALYGNRELNDGQTGGCVREAIDAQGSDTYDAVTELMTTYNDRLQRVTATSDMQQAAIDWATCMGEAGFGFGSQNEATASIQRQLEALMEPVLAQIVTIPQPEIADFLGALDSPADLPGLDAAALDELRADEIQLAEQDLSCYVAHVEPAYGPARARVEDELLAERSEGLAALQG